MNRTLLLIAAAISASFGAVSDSLAVDPDTTRVADNPDVRAAIAVFDAWVEHRVYLEEIPGMSIGVVHGKELVWSKGYGYANLEKKIPATPTTVYRIGSLTKLFTATAVLQLRDAGKLQLDDPVSKYLGWFHLSDPYGDSPPITIRHLLTHSSGLPREFEGLYWDDLKCPDRDTLIAKLQGASAILPREAKFKYSNVAFSVLGFVVEAVSGESYADYVANHIITPLGMTATAVSPSPQTPRLATGYQYRKPGKPRVAESFIDLKGMSAAGNMASTAEDLAKFLSLQFGEGPAQGSQILSGFTLKEMHRPHWLYEDWAGGRGLGWAVSRVDGQIRIGHRGYVNGFHAYIVASPVEKFGIVVLTNAPDGNPVEIANQAWSIIGPAIQKAAAVEEAPPKQTDPSWTRFVGVYELMDGSEWQVLLLHNELAFVDPSSDNPWAERIRLGHVSGNTFKMLGPPQEGELVHFEESGTGEVTRVVLPGYAAQRKK